MAAHQRSWACRFSAAVRECVAEGFLTVPSWGHLSRSAWEDAGHRAIIKMLLPPASRSSLAWGLRDAGRRDCTRRGPTGLFRARNGRTWMASGYWFKSPAEGATAAEFAASALGLLALGRAFRLRKAAAMAAALGAEEMRTLALLDPVWLGGGEVRAQLAEFVASVRGVRYRDALKMLRDAGEIRRWAALRTLSSKA